MYVDFHLFVDNFVSAVEAKDAYTAGHSDRVAEMAMLLTSKLGLSEEEQFAIHMAGHLHDIGKIGVADGILLKAGKLTIPEFEVMKSHSEIGHAILKNNPNLQKISEMVLYHHERYDGTGYPNQIVGENIPIGARIIAICDSFDAMVTKRTYKDKMSIDEAAAEIRKQRGKQFDPHLADIFLNLLEDRGQRAKIDKIVST